MSKIAIMLLMNFQNCYQILNMQIIKGVDGCLFDSDISMIKRAVEKYKMSYWKFSNKVQTDKESYYHNDYLIYKVDLIKSYEVNSKRWRHWLMHKCLLKRCIYH